jgi:beta-phosphoglucomutase-like phosphatase (HAD superfamily)
MGVHPGDCIVVENSVVGVAASMRVIGFAGGSHAAGGLGKYLSAAGARAVITDMRALKGAVIELRGW